MIWRLRTGSCMYCLKGEHTRVVILTSTKTHNKIYITAQSEAGFEV